MTERMKHKILSLLPVLMCLVGVMGLSFFWLHEYRQVSFTHISKFCEILIEDHPQAETLVLSSIKKYHTLKEPKSGAAPFLAQYGYDSGDFCGSVPRTIFILSVILFFSTICVFLLSTWYLSRRRQRRIETLTAYLEQVNLGAFGTVIQHPRTNFPICRMKYTRQLPCYTRPERGRLQQKKIMRKIWQILPTS